MSKKTLVFVYSDKCLKRLERFFDRRNHLVVSLTPALDHCLEELDVDFKSSLEYTVPLARFDTSYWECMNFIKKLGSLKIAGKSLDAHLTIDKISLFNLLLEDITLDYLDKTIRNLNVIDKILTQEKPKEVVFYDHYKFPLIERQRNIFPPLIVSACKKHKISLQKVWSLSNVKKAGTGVAQFAYNKLMDYRTLQRRKGDEKRFVKTKNKVLFAHYGDRTNITKPIYSQLLKRGADAMAVCSDGARTNTTSNALAREKMKFSNYEAFIDDEIAQKTKKSKKKYAKLWRMIKRNKKFQKQVSYRGFELYPFVKHYLSSALKGKLPNLASVVRTMDKIYREQKPNMTVVVSDWNFFQKSAVLTSEKYNIPSMVIQHGTVRGKGTFKPVDATYYALWFQREKENMKKYIDEKRLVVLGSIGHEFSLKNREKVNKATVLKELKIGKGKKVVLLAVRFNVMRNISQITDVLSVTKNMKNVVTIVKLHPAESEKSTQELARITAADPEKVRFLKRMHFFKLLEIADLVVSTEECTTSIDTIMFERPMILQDKKYPIDASYCAMGYGKSSPFPIVKNRKQLGAEMEKILFTSVARKKILRQTKDYKKKQFNFDGKAHKNAADFVMKVMKEK